MQKKNIYENQVKITTLAFADTKKRKERHKSHKKKLIMIFRFRFLPSFDGRWSLWQRYIFISVLRICAARLMWVKLSNKNVQYVMCCHFHCKICTSSIPVLITDQTKTFFLFCCCRSLVHFFRFIYLCPLQTTFCFRMHFSFLYTSWNFNLIVGMRSRVHMHTAHSTPPKPTKYICV